MKVIYIIGFPVDGSSGKSKATREKIKELNDSPSITDFKYFAARRNHSPLLKHLYLIFFDIKVSFSLLLTKGRYSVIQRTPFLPFIYFAQKIKSMKVINEFHADLKDEIPHLKKSSFEKNVLKALVPLFNLKYKLGDGIIFNHPILKKTFDPIYKKPSIYSYNGANYKEFRPESIQIAREKLMIDHSSTILLFIGSVSKWHGVDYLIDIFNQTNIVNNNQLYLYIVGVDKTPYSDYLKSTSKNKNIIFIPPVATDEANTYINASNFCMLPVKQIRISPGSPIKLYDYISCGKPIISQSNVMGYSDEVENYNLGFTIDLTNAKQAANNINDIVRDSKEPYWPNNRNAAMSFLSWKSRIKDWVIFIESMK